jgi:regulatory protein
VRGAPPGLKTRALRLLSRREYARAELRGRLEAWAERGDDLDGLLDGLEAAGLLSDARAAESAARRHTGRKGVAALASDLKRRGISGETAEDVLRTARDGEFQSAREVLRCRFPEPAVDAESRARQWRFLQARGFGADAIRAALKGSAPGDPD